jgi:hypothetical protein
LLTINSRFGFRDMKKNSNKKKKYIENQID